MDLEEEEAGLAIEHGIDIAILESSESVSLHHLEVRVLPPLRVEGRSGDGAGGAVCGSGREAPRGQHGCVRGAPPRRGDETADGRGVREPLAVLPLFSRMSQVFLRRWIGGTLLQNG